jgi:hypothetical protein
MSPIFESWAWAMASPTPKPQVKKSFCAAFSGKRLLSA